jgi:hypothetical protein
MFWPLYPSLALWFLLNKEARVMRKKKNAGPETPAQASAPAPVPASPRLVAAAKKTRKTEAPKSYVVIDHPMPGEIVRSAWYTFRIGASPADRVEISVDGKEWQPCRPAAGYWWYDWSGYGAGAHEIQARTPSGSRFATSKPRRFTVLI